LAFSGLAILSGCSDRGRAPATETSAQGTELTLPDTGLARDTSLVLSSRAEPVSPVEQQVARPEERPAKKAATPARRRRPPPPAPPAEDTSTRAYAPNPTPDSGLVADTTTTAISSAQQRDTTAAKIGDTAAAPAPDTVHVADTAAAPAPDTVHVADTVGNPAPDSVSARTPDTTPTTVADTAVASGGREPALASAAASASTARMLPIGTEIHAALDDSITSRRDTVGHTVAAHVMQNVTGPDGRTLVPAGTPVRFTITRLRAARSKGSQGRLALKVDGVTLNGQLRPVQAEVRPVPRELRGRGVTAGDAAKVGGGAVGGAVVGRVLGGSTRGAVIGGVAGAAAGAVVATQTATRDVVVKAKTPVVFVLTQPLIAP
jgi:hypothetical protein